MELKLTLNGKEKSYKSGIITGRMFRRSVEVRKQFFDGELMGENYGVDQLDEVVEFIVDYFGRQFTVDDFYDGFMFADAQEFVLLFLKVLNNIQTNEEKFKGAVDSVGK